ncbi:SHOCT domain-containing protein [Pseudanabaenaceae cyanobacterium LEGE 13415]|nr:SHOCT domain-containing protein [Pseudanabaenaceae cyanobacterium LEGE 13415]
MASLRIYFNISHRQSTGEFRSKAKSFSFLSAPKLFIDCHDDEAFLQINDAHYEVTHCNLDDLGDRGLQYDDKKEAFFQLSLDDGRTLVGYTENTKGFKTFMKQWRLMKRNATAKMREAAKAEKQATRTANARSTNSQNTVEAAKALKALKELLEKGILSQEEYEVKRQSLVDQL